MESNREYKDSVFRMYFNDEEKLKDLYRAVTGEECEEIHSVEIATLKDSIYGNIKNDISFIVNGRLFIFTEHMSTKNPNMPFRMLEYFVSSINMLIRHAAMLGPKLQKFPAPEFYVLYNGNRKLKEDEKILKLSSAYVGEPDMECSMELTVKVIDINIDSKDQIINNSIYVRQYSEFIGRIKRNYQECGDMDQAIDEAIAYCIENGIMVEFLKDYGQKVRSMIFTQFSDEEMMEIRVNGEVEVRLEEELEKRTKELEERVTSEVTEKVTSEVTERVTEENIGKLISVMKELGAGKELAEAKLIEKYGLSEEEASDIVERNW